MGLFLGASILTLFEIFYYFCIHPCCTHQVVRAPFIRDCWEGTPSRAHRCRSDGKASSTSPSRSSTRQLRCGMIAFVVPVSLQPPSTSDSLTRVFRAAYEYRISQSHNTLL